MEYVEKPCKRVSVEDRLEAVKLMNTGKTAGPSGIKVDLLKMCEKESILRLTKVACDRLNGKSMPKSLKE